MISREAGVVILAAGKSERMKEFKAFLPFEDKVTFIEKIISTYAGWGCSEIVVVVNQDMMKRTDQLEGMPGSVKLVVNRHPEFERFYSAKLGLGAIWESDWCFLQNIDNPFIDSHILDIIYDHRSTEKYISPVYENKGGHPVLLNRKNIHRISSWNSDSADLKEVLKTMDRLNVEMSDDKVLININSPEEYQSFFKARAT